MPKDQSVSRFAISGVIWMFAGSTVQLFLQLGIISVLARLLSPTEFGIVSVIMIMVSFTYIFTQLGIGASLIQLKDITREHISVGYSLSILLGFVICILFYLLAPAIGIFFKLKGLDTAIRFFSFFFPIKSFNSVSEGLLQRKLKFAVTVKANSISYFLGFGATSITMALLHYGYWSIIYGQLVQLLIYTGLLMYYERPIFSLKFDKAIFKQLMSFGTGHTLATVFNYFAENADNMVTGRLLGPTQLGIYSRAFQFLSIPSRFFGAIFDNVLFPVLSSKQEDKVKLSGFYLFSLTFCFVLLFPISIFLIINAGAIIKILLGDNWNEVIYPFQVLILGLTFRFGTKINKSFLKSLGLVYKGAYYQFIFAALILGFSWIGAYWYGLAGVAWGVLAATIINYFQISYRLQKVLLFKSKVFMQLHTKSLLFSLPFTVVMLIIFFLCGVRDYKYLALGLSVLVYLPLFLFSVTRKKSVLYHGSNKLYLLQIINNLPGAIKKHITKTKFYQQLYAA